MSTINNHSGGQHDGQKNYQHSNQRNPDNIRNATRDHQYKEHDETLTNDANFDPDTHQPKIDLELDNKRDNADKDGQQE